VSGQRQQGAPGGGLLRRRLRLATGLLLAVAAAGLLGERVYMGLKAELAQVLLDRAFAAELRTGEVRKPWSWADMHPVAELEVPRLNLRRSVLSGASGESMAFGLGHLHGTAQPGEAGNSVIAGHRDSWASFLEDLSVGDELLLRSTHGRQRYRVVATQVVHRSDTRVLRDERDGVTLLTCWPFDGLLSSPWRYLVRAEPVAVPSRALTSRSRSLSTAAGLPASRG